MDSFNELPIHKYSRGAIRQPILAGGQPQHGCHEDFSQESLERALSNPPKVVKPQTTFVKRTGTFDSVTKNESPP
jgi:hypothetical protein